MRWLAPLARVLGSAALLGVLIWQLSPSDLAAAFGGVKPEITGLAALVMLAVLMLMAYKWYMLARVRRPQVNAPPLARAFFQGTLLNFVLPTGIGGDAYRVLRLRQLSDGRLTDASASVIFDRATGYVGMAVFAGLGAAFVFGGLATGLSALASLVVFALLAAV
ncbi:MAG: flippase-like domain-containing protein, partial [Planctomycetes bacterium]|nr:flippase-like domain-containing protein [Planctomycetota bacterium]